MITAALCSSFFSKGSILWHFFSVHYKCIYDNTVEITTTDPLPKKYVGDCNI